MAAEQVAAIIQARMGSARFPGKTLAPFSGSTVLQHVLERLRQAAHPLQIWVATSECPEDNAIADLCSRDGFGVARGSADDVLGRFAACLEQMPDAPPLVLRVCADRPLLCPALVDELLDAYDDVGRPDYLSNNLPPSYPDGLDLELVRAECLRQAAAESDDPYEREHVTPFVYRRPERFSVLGLICPWGDFSHVDVALDTPADYERLKRLRALLPERFDHRDVLNAATLHPELTA